MKELFERSGRGWARRLSLGAGWQRDGGRDNRWNGPDPWGDDRYSPSGGLRLPLTYSGMILVICVLLLFVRYLAPAFTFNYLALNPAFVASRPWTLITHIFVHANMEHLFFNMLFLFFFGTELERRVGESRFLQIFIISGLVAAIGQMAVVPTGYMMGASGALYGVMGCLAVIAPEIRVLLFFVIPLSIRAAVVLFAVLDFTMMGSADSIAHMAHITGLLAGLAYGGMLKDRYRYRYR
ncbi:MAG TPA: rhomboid family intramembrane serine protease [Methanothrix sp.]|nr:rhomboid family intramembrane serine protease [Methanothrix sp.]HPJ84057.1 rhomboid family intramembrane serine protease [Methanothrix sp.]HPR67239.1 rhomboid family intramembrane serine protease [Methanothrix sp.]